MRTFEVRNRHFDRLFNTPGLMWFGQNTNHFPTHPAVRQAMIDSIDAEEFHAYAPPAGLEELRSLILADLGLTDAAVLVTDGAVEALYNVCRALSEPGSQFVTTDPGWKWPMQFAMASGARVLEIPIYRPDNNYRLTPAQLADAVTDSTRIIYLVDPNNPLGICYSGAEIKAFTDIARGVRRVFPARRDVPPLRRRAHACGARSIPSARSPSTASRSGSGSPACASARWWRSPVSWKGWPLHRLNNLGCNVISQRAAIAGLKVKQRWLPDINRRQRRNQAEIHRAVGKIPGLEVVVYPSQGNFLVVECIEAGIAPEALCRGLSCREGIMIRQGSYHTPTFRPSLRQDQRRRCLRRGPTRCARSCRPWSRRLAAFKDPADRSSREMYA